MQTISVKSHIPSSLRLKLSWGRTMPAPETANFIRLDNGEDLTIAAGHATSIRSIDGWHEAYAFEDTIITGPIDISTPHPMTPKSFSPSVASPSSAEAVVLCSMILGSGLILIAVSGFSFLVQLGAFCAVAMIIFLTLLALIKASQRRAAASDSHDCAAPTERTFWRSDLTAAQSEEIRPA